MENLYATALICNYMLIETGTSWNLSNSSYFAPRWKAKQTAVYSMHIHAPSVGKQILHK